VIHMKEFTTKVVEPLKEFNLESITLKDFLTMQKDKPEGLAIVLTQAPGALPNGTRVRKINSLGAKDAHQDGALATVVGSVGPLSGTYGYFVFWDDVPNIPCFIAGNRIEIPNLTPGLTEEEIINRAEGEKCK
jgi:hypothetical protein